MAIFQVDHKRDPCVEIVEELRRDLGDKAKILIFAEKQITTDFLGSYLCELDFPSTTMHGARDQQQREEALRKFRRGICPILGKKKVDLQ